MSSRKARMRKQRQDAKKKKKGLMVGMRKGLKKVGKAVSDDDATPEKKSNWLNHVITLVLVAAVVYVLYTRFG